MAVDVSARREPLVDITIERVTHADEALLRLQRQTFPHDTPAPTSVGAWWLALDQDGGAVAFAGVQPAKHWPGAWYLVRCGVLPEYRGHNLQHRLIKARLRYARAAGGVTAVSATAAWNAHSARNLIRSGFLPYEPNEPWLENGIYWKRGL